MVSGLPRRTLPGYPLVGGSVESLPKRKQPKTTKMLVTRAACPPSAARVVGRQPHSSYLNALEGIELGQGLQCQMTTPLQFDF